MPAGYSLMKAILQDGKYKLPNVSAELAPKATISISYERQKQKHVNFQLLPY